MLGVPIGEGNSDSQDLNRTIETPDPAPRPLASPRRWRWWCRRSSTRSRALPDELHSFYMYLRQTMGPFAQGPVALIARHDGRVRVLGRRDRPAPAVAARDRPGLRLQLRAGRRLGRRRWSPSRSRWRRARSSWSDRPRAQALDAPPARRDAARGPQALAGADRRRARSRRTTARCETGGPLEGPEIPGYTDAGPEEPVKVEDRVLAGFGWQRDDVKLVQQMAYNGAEPIGSLGYDGPLAALSPGAPEPGRLLQGDGRGRHQPGDRPRARDRALLDPRASSAAGRRSRIRRQTPARSRPTSR